MSDPTTPVSRSGLADLALGPIRWQLTSLGRTLLFPCAFGLYRAVSSPVIYAPLVVIVGLYLVDAWRSQRDLSAVRLRLVPVRSRAALPDRIAYLTTVVAGSAEGLFLELGLAGGNGFSPKTMLSATRTRVEPRVVGASSQTYQDFRVTHSSLGFVSARQDGVQRLTQRMSQAVLRHPADVEPLASARIDELAHLRPYVSGDRPNRVNWNATARTGELHVRDDLQRFDQAVVVVDLGVYSASDPADREAAVGALTRLLVERAWQGGLAVRLISRQLSSGFHDYVATTHAARHDPTFARSAGVVGSADTIEDDVVIDDEQLIGRLASLCHGDPVPRPDTAHYLVTKSGVVRVE